MRKRAPEISSEDFVLSYMEVYEVGGDSRDLARLLNKSTKHVHQTASRLRRHGVKLPYFQKRSFRHPDGRTQSAIEYLNSLIYDGQDND